MKTTKTINKLFAGLIFLFMLSIVFLSGFGVKGSHQVMAATSSEQYDYTDSDYLVPGGSYTIRDYSEQLIASKAHVQHVEDEGYQIADSDQDDPIVKIIPKNLFYTVGSELVIGQEYGYYINTTALGLNYKSTALVFDIVTEANLEVTTDRVFITVKPLFEYKYVCVSGQDSSVFMDGHEVTYSNSDYCVVPYASISNLAIRYNETNQYYLKDISFAGSLYNEQHLNPGDPLYDAYEDYGSYFTAFDYEYSGRYRKNNSFPIDESATV